MHIVIDHQGSLHQRDNQQQGERIEGNRYKELKPGQYRQVNEDQNTLAEHRLIIVCMYHCSHCLVLPSTNDDVARLHATEELRGAWYRRVKIRYIWNPSNRSHTVRPRLQTE